MILLDPDLDHYPEPKTPSAKPRSVSAVLAKSSSVLLPSARTLARFLKEAQAEVRLPGRVSVLLTTDKAIRRLNRQFRGIDKATDVLSFPATEFFQDRKTNKEKVAGDLAISVPTARLQAAEQSHAVAIELKVLILHGLLHLAGYDHETDTGQMARRECRLRAQLGLPQGLIERAQPKPVRERVGPTASGGKARTHPILSSTTRRKP